jgi:hypothetical protein
VDLATSGTDSSNLKYNRGKGYSTPYLPDAFLSDFMSLIGVDPINYYTATKEINRPETEKFFFSNLL